MTETIKELLKINNQFYSSAPLRMSFGAATGEPGETVESVIRRADAQMYEHKRAYYEADGAGDIAKGGLARRAL
ncbi:GGDEF domain-containing protein [Mycoplana sp. BE70]|nr:GGDEF domain-containing protein [Mycoplana sp. BE70]